jgi:hypothetical protein
LVLREQPVWVKMSRATHFVGTQVYLNKRTRPAGGRHFRVGPIAEVAAAFLGPGRFPEPLIILVPAMARARAREMAAVRLEE